jgi:hypothetical protein
MAVEPSSSPPPQARKAVWKPGFVVGVTRRDCNKESVGSERETRTGEEKRERQKKSLKRKVNDMNQFRKLISVINRIGPLIRMGGAAPA